jgi:dolichol-phosphate mannosyltransferase
MEQKPELIVVSPVFNESSVIQQFISDWIVFLRSFNILFEMRMYDDGSTDNTAELIQQLQSDFKELKYFKKENTGHGPSVTYGYQGAADFDWIFQIDSDHELPLEEFEKMWNIRNNYDLLLGKRIKRNNSTFRKLLTFFTSICVKILVGNGITDINTPYRLIRGQKLRSFLLQNNPQNFAPNVILSAFAVRNKWKIVELPITPLRTRQLKKRGYSLYLLKGGISTALELIRFSLKK